MMKWNKHSTHSFVKIILFAILTLSSWAHAATETNKPEQALEVVLVMDSSGSMKKTDPQELRKPAAKLFISLLGEHDKASVVSFSDQGYPVAFLTPVKGKVNQEKLFKAVGKISTKGVYTNLHGAIEAAQRVFAYTKNNKTKVTYTKNDKTKISSHKRVIILMSDGKMDLGSEAETKKQTELMMSETLPLLKQQGIEVHTIAFSPQSDHALLKLMAETTGGVFNISQSDKDLHDVYSAIFEQSKSPNMLPFDGEKFTIDSAIKEVTIIGSKDSSEVVLSLIGPDERMYSSEDQTDSLKWFVSEQFDLITIKKPQPGLWKIKASSGKNKAYIITDLEQQLEVEPEIPVVNEGVYIKTWLEEKGHILNKESVNQSLTVELHVDTPEGDNHVLPMEPEINEEGIPTDSGIYTSLIALPSEGKYAFKIIAKSTTFSREKHRYVTAVAATVPVQPVAEEPVVEEPPVEHEPPVAQITETAVEEPMISPPIKKSVKHESVSKKPEHAVNEKHTEEAADNPVKNKKAKTKKKKKSKKAKDKKNKDEETTASEEHKEDGPGMVTAILIFLGINVFLIGIGGGVYFFLKKRRSRNAGDDGDEEAQADNENEHAAKDKAA